MMELNRSCCCRWSSASFLLEVIGTRIQAFLSDSLFSPTVSSTVHAAQTNIKICVIPHLCCFLIRHHKGICLSSTFTVDWWVIERNRNKKVHANYTSSTSSIRVTSVFSHLLFKNKFSFLSSLIDFAIYDFAHVTDRVA